MKRKKSNINPTLTKEQQEQRRNSDRLTVFSKEIDISTLMASRRNKKQVKD